MEQAASITDRLRVLPQYVIPQHLLSRMIYHLARCRWILLKNLLIKLFCILYKPDLAEAEITDYRKYENFNAFFTRSLKSTVRPVNRDESSVICPVDGYISQLGIIDHNLLLQAKNRLYTLDALLADERQADHFNNGVFATLYLSPANYHRVHMPLDGNLVQMSHVPGQLFSVNHHTSLIVDQLFARNERVICLFETAAGLMAVILVGAIFVGNMETVWSGEITPAVNGSVSTQFYKDEVHLQKGQELGRFNMGSTVIVLFANRQCSWLSDLRPSDPVRMGMVLGKTGS